MAIIITMISSAIVVPCRGAGDVIEQFDNGWVNWSRGKIHAEGRCRSDQNNPQKAVNCEKVLANAKMKARHNLLKTTKSVRVKNDLTIGAYAGKNDVIMVKLMDMVKQAPVIQQKYSTDGTAKITVEMTLSGGLSQLVLPAEIKHVEAIKPVSPPTPGHPPLSTPTPGKELYSGLIVDARGLNILPVMTPKILDENRQEVYGPAFVSRELAVQKGLCHYETDMGVARSHEKMADNPLTVKGLRYGGPSKTDIIISNRDALKLKSDSEHLIFLKKCQVIIVVDPTEAQADPS